MRRGFVPWDDPAARPLVRVDGVSKRFSGVAAVERLSLDVYEGEFFALLGPSGCGKTTLLRLLAGFETPDEGRLLLGGADIAGVPPYRRPVNMMFQNYALFPHMTVARNVAFGLKQDRLPRAEIEARVAKMLALVKLEALAARKPHQLSGGQRQRVALARALAKHPQVLLLDEPLAALDRRLREQTQSELIDLQARIGTTFVIVTHDQEEAMTMAHRIAVMDHGRVVQVATPAELYERPNSRWAAEFIGDVNLIEAVAVGGGAQETVIETAAGQKFRAPACGEAKPGGRVWLAVRPEKLRLGVEPPSDASANRLTGRVQDVGYLGDKSVYKVRLDDGAVMRVSSVNAGRAGEPRIGWDERVWLSWPADVGVVLTR
jgi:putrescine transport system ATP-binding protein